MKADEDFQAELVRQYGPEAGNARYNADIWEWDAQTRQASAILRALADAWQAAPSAKT